MKKFFFIFLLSNVAYWIAALFRGYVSITSSILVEGLVYFLLTWWLFKKYVLDNEPPIRILFPLLFGLFWLELPYRIIEILFNDGGANTNFTMLHLIMTPFVIMLSYHWYKHRNFIVLTIAALLWLIVTIIGNTYWMEFFRGESLF